MRTTIDRAGRVVIPKQIRDAAGLSPGAEIDVELHDGRIEIVPAMIPARVVQRGGRTVIEFETDRELPKLTPEDVRAVLESVRP